MSIEISLTILASLFYMLIGAGFAKVSAKATYQEFDIIVMIFWPLAAVIAAFVVKD